MLRQLSLGVLVALAGPSFAQNLVTNGSFESGLFTPDASSSQSIAVGSSAITGWSVVSDTTLWIANGNPWSLSASNGSRFLDLTDHQSFVPIAGLSQMLATTPGTAYRLTFDLGSSASFGVPISLQASVGSVSQVFQVNSTASNVWTTMSLDFIATSTSTNLALQGISGTSYVGLDNVAVLAQVPEAPSALMLALGVVGLWGVKRMRDGRPQS